jgi:hypothetical protein
VPGATAEAVPGRHDLDQPDGFWDVVLGSGYRATVDALRPDQQDQLREQLLRRLHADGITVLCTDVASLASSAVSWQTAMGWSYSAFAS